MKTNVVTVFIFILAFASTEAAPPNGNAMRAAFMTTLDLVYSALALEKSKGGVTDANRSEVASKFEAALALAKTVDPQFLKWVEPGLPDAFSHLKQCLELRSKGLRSGDLPPQIKANEHWLKWGAYWGSHDEAIYLKLKVPSR